MIVDLQSERRCGHESKDANRDAEAIEPQWKRRRLHVCARRWSAGARLGHGALHCISPLLEYDTRPMTQAPKIGLVSLGCPKALVDSERIMSTLRSQGYEFSRDYAGADVVLVNTCGFLDSAKQESLEAIGEAISENGRVIVTGCLGIEEELITKTHPSVLAVTGPHQ